MTKRNRRNGWEKLLDSKETAWRVSKGDLERNQHFKRYQDMNEEMLLRTDTAYAPWHIVEATDRKFATAKIYSIVVQMLESKIAELAEAARRAAQADMTVKEMDDQVPSAVG